jgi:hypothetical protein
MNHKYMDCPCWHINYNDLNNLRLQLTHLLSMFIKWQLVSAPTWVIISQQQISPFTPRNITNTCQECKVRTVSKHQSSKDMFKLNIFVSNSFEIVINTNSKKIQKVKYVCRMSTV